MRCDASAGLMASPICANCDVAITVFPIGCTDGVQACTSQSMQPRSVERAASAASGFRDSFEAFQLLHPPKTFNRTTNRWLLCSTLRVVLAGFPAVHNTVSAAEPTAGVSECLVTPVVRDSGRLCIQPGSGDTRGSSIAHYTDISLRSLHRGSTDIVGLTRLVRAVSSIQSGNKRKH